MAPAWSLLMVSSRKPCSGCQGLSRSVEEVKSTPVPWPWGVHINHAITLFLVWSAICSVVGSTVARIYHIRATKRMVQTQKRGSTINRQRQQKRREGGGGRGRETRDNDVIRNVGDFWPQDKVASLANPPPPNRGSAACSLDGLSVNRQGSARHNPREADWLA